MHMTIGNLFTREVRQGCAKETELETFAIGGTPAFAIGILARFLLGLRVGVETDFGWLVTPLSAHLSERVTLQDP